MASADSPRTALEARFGPVAELFAALATPVRSAIVHELAEGERAVNELVSALGVSQPLVSQHLRALRNAHLVSVERRGQSMVYRLADDHVAHIFGDAFRHVSEVETRPLP